ncbi:MAG: DinB family protein [Plesiomonas sp.]
MLPHHLQQQLLYHRWAYRILQRQLRSLPTALLVQDSGLSFGSIINTLNHLLVSERQSLARLLNQIVPDMAPDTIVTVDTGALFEQLAHTGDQWLTIVTQLAELSETQRTHAGNLISEVILHAVHHRGQISAVMTNQGYPAPKIDFAAYRREQAARAIEAGAEAVTGSV